MQDIHLKSGRTEGSISACTVEISGSSHTSDLKISAVAILPGNWYDRISAGTVWPGVSTLWLEEVESLICNFHHLQLSDQIHPWDTLARCWDVKPTNQPTNMQEDCLSPAKVCSEEHYLSYPCPQTTCMTFTTVTCHLNPTDTPSMTTSCTYLDTIMPVVEELTPPESTQHLILMVVGHVMGTDGR